MILFFLVSISRFFIVLSFTLVSLNFRWKRFLPQQCLPALTKCFSSSCRGIRSYFLLTLFLTGLSKNFNFGILFFSTKNFHNGFRSISTILLHSFSDIFPLKKSFETSFSLIFFFKMFGDVFCRFFLSQDKNYRFVYYFCCLYSS